MDIGSKEPKLSENINNTMNCTDIYNNNILDWRAQMSEIPLNGSEQVNSIHNDNNNDTCPDVSLHMQDDLDKDIYN